MVALNLNTFLKCMRPLRKMILHAVDAMEKVVGHNNSSFGNSYNYTMSSDPSVPIVVDNGTGVSLDYPSKPRHNEVEAECLK